jgi:hypothetical protein
MKTEYKLGDWLKNIHTGQMIEITAINKTADGIHLYSVQRVDNSYRRLSIISYSVLQENYEFMKLARLLYMNNISKGNNQC